MANHRLIDRIYLVFVILVGCWSLQLYYRFCFSDVLYTVTARSIIITTTTTQDISDSATGTVNKAANAVVNSIPTKASSDGSSDTTTTVDEPGEDEGSDNDKGTVTVEGKDGTRYRVDHRSKNEIEEALRNKRAYKQAKKEAILRQKLAKLAETSGTGEASSSEKIPGDSRAKVPRRRITRRVEVHPLTLKERFSPIVLRDIVWLLVSLFVTVMMVWSYYLAVMVDPGKVPRCFSVFAQKSARMALSTGGTLTKCQICSVFKPPRTHHCSKCDRCVLKYDHHCHWIGQCVGYFNYKPFFVLCFWVTIFSYVSSFSLSRSVYLYVLGMLKKTTPTSTSLHSLSKVTAVYIQASPLLGSTEVAKVKVTFDVFLLFIVLMLAGSLAFYQLKKHYYLMLENKTTVEEMVLGDDPSPYDMGATYNLEEVFGDRGFVGPSWMRWIFRIIPSLPYGRQSESEVNSVDYFNMMRAQRRKARLAAGAQQVAVIIPPCEGAEDSNNGGAASDGTISQPSSNDTEDPQRQAEKVRKRAVYAARIEKRRNRRMQQSASAQSLTSDGTLSPRRTQMASRIESYGTLGQSNPAEGCPTMLAETPAPPPDEASGLLGAMGDSTSYSADYVQSPGGTGDGAVVHLCPKGTHFRKHIEDTASDEDEDEDVEVEMVPPRE